MIHFESVELISISSTGVRRIECQIWICNVQIAAAALAAFHDDTVAIQFSIGCYKNIILIDRIRKTGVITNRNASLLMNYL